MPDPHLFLYSLQQDQISFDWLPFSQTKYIEEYLHGGLRSQSKYAAGICAVLCVFALRAWMTKKEVSSEFLGVIDRFSNVEEIEAMANLFEEGKSRELAVNLLTRAGYPSKGEQFFRTPQEAIVHTVGLPYCFMAWGGIAKEGHAIIASGTSFAIFDPNVGYMKMKGKQTYTMAFNKLIAEWYPEFKQGTGITVNHF